MRERLKEGASKSGSIKKAGLSKSGTAGMMDRRDAGPPRPLKCGIADMRDR